MLQIPYFIQECPVCGRPTKVLAENHQRDVTCSHCQGHFVASNPASVPDEQSGIARGNCLLNRAERLLHRAHSCLSRHDWPTVGLGGEKRPA